MVKTLPNNNYSVRKLQTNLTQILHRIRLRPLKSTHKLPDISTPLKDFQQDNEVIIQHDNLYALAWQELYQKDPTHLGNTPSPDPKLIPPNTETADETTHPDPMPEPENIINHPEAQADDLTLDIADEPKDTAPTPKSPRKSKYNLRQNPTSNWKPGFAYDNPIEVNPNNSIILNHGPDYSPEIQVLADLGPDGGLRSEN